jgi:hypothetical protein
MSVLPLKADIAARVAHDKHNRAIAEADETWLVKEIPDPAY